MHHVYFLAICAIWGSNFILMSRAGLAFGPVQIGFWRLFGGGLVLIAYWFFSARRRIALRYWPQIAVLGLFANAVPFAIQPYLIGGGFGHSFFGFMVAFVPLCTIAVSIPMLNIWPTWQQLAGVCGGLLALALLVWEGQDRGMSAGMLALAFSVPLVYAVGNSYIRWKLSELPTTVLTGGILLMGALWLLPFVAIGQAAEMIGLPAPQTPQAWPIAISSLVWLGTVGTGVSCLLFVRLIQERGPLFAGMVSYLVPLVALAWGAYDREPITPRQLAVVVLVLAMVALVQFSPPPKLHRSSIGKKVSFNPQQKTVAGNPEPIVMSE